MNNPYTTPNSDIRKEVPDIAGASPYSVVQLRKTFKIFTISYWGYLISFTMIPIVMFIYISSAVKNHKESNPQAPLDNDSISNSVASLTGPFALVALILAITMVVSALALLYRHWSVMQPYSQRTTPGKAVGLLFVPLFNLWWMFEAYHGLAKDIEKYIDNTPDSNAPRPSTNLVLFMLILILATVVPYLNILAALALIVVIFLAKRTLNNSIIGIIQDRGRLMTAQIDNK